MIEILIGGMIIGLTIAFLVWFIFDNDRLKRKVEKIRRDTDYLLTGHGDLCNIIEETNKDINNSLKETEKDIYISLNDEIRTVKNEITLLSGTVKLLTASIQGSCKCNSPSNGSSGTSGSRKEILHS